LYEAIKKMGLIEDLLLLVLGPLFWFLWIIWAIIGILLIIGIVLYFRYASRKTINLTIRWVFFALLQTLLFLSLIWAFETFEVFTLVVTRFNNQVFTTGELAMVVFIIMLILDFLTEIIRHSIIKAIPKSVVLTSVLVSIIQFILLLFVLYILSSLGIITLAIISSYELISGNDAVFLLLFFTFILISEMVIEYIRIKIIGDKKQ